MVLTTDTRFSDIYNIIKSESLQGESVLILVARDCDSIAACKILTEILKSDLIAYNVKAVSGYEDLENVNSTLLSNEEIKSIIMINCGGNIDITDVFSNLNDQQVAYIIDSHRPYSQNNIKNESNVLIIDDGAYNEENELQQLTSDEEEEDGNDNEDEDEEDEEDEEEEGQDGEGVDNDEEVDTNDENEDINNKENKDNNIQKKKKKRKNLKRKKKSKKNQNYIEKLKKSYYGKSAAVSMYTLSTFLHKQNLEDLLWYAILGLTDQLIHEKITLDSYEQQYKQFKQLILNNYPSEDDEDANNNDYGSSHDENGNKTGQKQRSLNGDIIIPSDDFRFMLYRHWNLYESLYNSRYIACKLKVWKSKGKFLLESLFAVMGIPLDQVKQKYVSMNIHYKKSLKHLLANNAPRFGLINLYFNSFLKKYQCNSEISASDTVYAVTALMESDNLESDQSDQEIWEQNFWDAYDSMSSKNIDLLKIGLNQSIELQKEITRQVASMIEKRSVILSGPFRYAFINESSDLKYFIHPLALCKLGLFMMDAFISMGKIRKPFLIGALNEIKNSYLIVGISGSHSSDIQSNTFGEYFKKSAEYTNATIKYQSFDTSIIEVSKSDLHKFVEHLHGTMQNSHSKQQQQNKKK